MCAAGHMFLNPKDRLAAGSSAAFAMLSYATPTVPAVMPPSAALPDAPFRDAVRAQSFGTRRTAAQPTQSNL